MTGLKRIAGRMLPWNRTVREAERLGEDYRATFATEAGQRVLADLVLRSGLLDVAPPVDAHGAVLQSGRASLALYLVDQLRWQPGDILRMARLDADHQLAEIMEEDE